VPSHSEKFSLGKNVTRICRVECLLFKLRLSCDRFVTTRTNQVVTRPGYYEGKIRMRCDANGARQHDRRRRAPICTYYVPVFLLSIVVQSWQDCTRKEVDVKMRRAVCFRRKRFSAHAIYLACAHTHAHAYTHHAYAHVQWQWV